MTMQVLLFKNIKGVFPIEGFRLEVYLREFTGHCVILVLFQVFLCSLNGRWYKRLTRENILQMVQRSPHLSTRRMASRIGVSRIQVWRTLHEEICILTMIKGYNIWNQATMFNVWICATAHQELLSLILFTDEASFTRDGINNLRNVHTWSHRNPHATCVTPFQRRFSVNVWCGVLGNRLIGHLYLTTISRDTYEAFLRHELPGLL